jgi:hypothetical protein
MYSRLFRRETGRRLRAVSAQIVERYLDRRFAWLDSFSRPQPEGIDEYVRALADAVSADAPDQYFDYSLSHLQELLRSGTAPIALLAAGDLLQDSILEFVTPDQREALWELFAQEREQRQSVVRDWITPAERGA